MDNNTHLSLTGLQQLIAAHIDGAFPMPLWVVAEISELKVNYSGHCYLELVEKGGRNQVPKSKAAAVIWRSTYGAIDSYFHSITGKELAVGMKVMVRVAVAYHALYGLSLQISDIDPKYTLGDMEQQRQMTIAQLQQDGVFEMNRELEMPPLVQRIAVVSSRNAAGYQDFMNELAASTFHFEVELFDAFMQGHGAESSIISALERVVEQADRFDVLLLIRGGGSQSDLGCFDSYRLCSHLAQFPLPMITGIGHDKDQSVADMVAAVSLKTPTAAAGYLIERLTRADSYLDGLYGDMESLARGILDARNHRLKDLTYQLSLSAAAMIRSADVHLQRLAVDVCRMEEGGLIRAASHLDLMERNLEQYVRMAIENSRATLRSIERLVESRSPENILALGFAIVRSGGKAVKSAAALSPGTAVDISFAVGSALAEIKKVEEIKTDNDEKRECVLQPGDSRG